MSKSEDRMNLISLSQVMANLGLNINNTFRRNIIEEGEEEVK